MTDHPDISGYCPMGCGRTLFVGQGGYITCAFVTCPRPDAVADLLADWETEHVVEFGDTGFTVRHPLRERLDDELMRCPLHEHIARLDGPPVRPGRYRARGHKSQWAGDGWSWELLDSRAAQADTQATVDGAAHCADCGGTGCCANCRGTSSPEPGFTCHCRSTHVCPACAPVGAA